MHTMLALAQLFQLRGGSEMRQYRGKGATALQQRRHRTAMALLAALALAPLAAWTGQGTPLAAGYRDAPVAIVHGGAAGASGPIASAIPANASTATQAMRGRTLSRVSIAVPARAQRWTLPGDNTIRMRGKCLTVGRKSSGTGAVLAPCNGSAAQFWEADGIVRIPGTELVNPWSGKCLDDPHGSTTDHTQVSLSACNRSPAQIWYLPPGPP